MRKRICPSESLFKESFSQRQHKDFEVRSHLTSESDLQTTKRIRSHEHTDDRKAFGFDNIHQQRKVNNNQIFQDVNLSQNQESSEQSLKGSIKSYQQQSSIFNHSQSNQQSQLSQDSSTHKSQKQIGSKRRRYAVYDQQFKEEVCLAANKYGISFATQKFALSTRKVLNWIEAQNNNLLGKGRKALDPAMEYNLSIWILRKIWDRIPLTQKIIREKGVRLKTLERKFNGSKGWLEKFFLRHVELKSSFDYRNQQDMKQQCARYHRYAFIRIEKDYEDFIKSSNIQKKNLVSGDLTKIIYFKGNHSLLRLNQDRKIDKDKKGQQPLFCFKKLLSLSDENRKIQEQSSENQEISEEQENDGIYKKVKKEECLQEQFSVESSLWNSIYEDSQSPGLKKEQEN